MVEQIDLRKNMESNKNRIANSYSFFMHLYHLTIYVKSIIMVGTRQISILLERGYGMATCRKRNLKKILDSRRKEGERLKNIHVADWLWEKVENDFNFFSAFELEQIKRIRIEFVAHTDCIGINVLVKDPSTRREIRVKKLDEILLLSPRRMENIDQIMSYLMDIARHNGLKTLCYTDKGVLAEDELKYWEVKWTAQ